MFDVLSSEALQSTWYFHEARWLMFRNWRAMIHQPMIGDDLVRRNWLALVPLIACDVFFSEIIAVCRRVAAVLPCPCVFGRAHACACACGRAFQFWGRLEHSSLMR
jgi:hypothetical protein